MDFLGSKNIYHGDLAARNVLLTSTLDAKISDFGLSRRIYDEINTAQPLRKKGEEILPSLPIKWMALEVLLLQEFIPIKSDVWSFGVTAWEIFTCAKAPYSGIDLRLLVYQLCAGKRLPDPDFCPSTISILLKQCFRRDPSLRPDFGKIKSDLKAAHEAILDQKPRDHSSTKNSSNVMETQYAIILRGNQESQNSANSRGEEEQQPMDRESITYADLDIEATTRTKHDSSQNEKKYGLNSMEYSAVKKLPRIDHTSKLFLQRSDKLKRSISFQDTRTEKDIEITRLSVSETILSSPEQISFINK